MMIFRKMWCLVRCLFGRHFWTLSDKKNTKECFHCEKEVHLEPKLWESFRVHEGESETMTHLPHDPNEHCEVCTPVHD